MSQTIEVQGTLQTDGTLLLDEKPALPAGRVKVILQPVAVLPVKDPLGTMQRIWAERMALGLPPLSAAEIDAELAAMRDEWEEHQQALERIQEEARSEREKNSC